LLPFNDVKNHILHLYKEALILANFRSAYCATHRHVMHGKIGSNLGYCVGTGAVGLYHRGASLSFITKG
jgi:hypothetical protein